MGNQTVKHMAELGDLLGIQATEDGVVAVLNHAHGLFPVATPGGSQGEHNASSVIRQVAFENQAQINQGLGGPAGLTFVEI